MTLDSITVASAESGMESFITKGRQVFSVEKLPGDASTRRYYRVKTSQGNTVVMAMDSFKELGESIPFIQVQRHLHQAGVDVPKIIDLDPKSGFIMLEDLGDTVLLRSLQNVSNLDEERKFFQRAIDALVKMHVHSGPKNAKSELEGFRLKFDVEKLMWEINFAIEHFYLKHLNRVIPEKDLELIRTQFTKICQEIESEPTVFTHRDYHSRNIMVVQNSDGTDRYVLIDFQDARMGACQYDLASLLRDSYYQLSENQIETLVHYYQDQMQHHGYVFQKDREHFMRIFDLMSVQRNFKAIGSFASFLNRKGNPAYLKFIGNTFENIRRNLMKYPEFKDLREVLYHYYYF